MSTMRNYVGVQNGKIKNKCYPKIKLYNTAILIRVYTATEGGEEGSLINLKHFLKLAKTPWLLEMGWGDV